MPNKAIAAGGTTAVAGAIATIIFGLWNHPVTPDLQAAITTLISATLSGVATYLTPHNDGAAK